MARKEKRVESDVGEIEIRDAETGELIAKQMESKGNLERIEEGRPPKRKKAHTKWIWKKNKNGVPLLVENAQNAWELPDDYQAIRAEKQLHLNIAMLVSEGHTFTAISKFDNMPPRYVLFNWYARCPEFKVLIDEARRLRAEHYHDKLAEVAETVKEYNAKSSKVKADIYKALMAVGDRERFGTQTKVVGDPNAPIAFIIDTGIRRQEQEPPIPVESRVINEGPPEDHIDGLQAPTTPERDPSES